MVLTFPITFIFYESTTVSTYCWHAGIVTWHFTSLDWWNNAMWFVLHESNTSSPIRYVDDLLNRRRNDEYSNWSAGCILCCCSFLAKSLFFAGVRASCPKGPWTEPRSFNWLLNFFNSPQACDLKTTACPALTRLIGYMSLHAPYAYGAWLKAC